MIAIDVSEFAINAIEYTKHAKPTNVDANMPNIDIGNNIIYSKAFKYLFIITYLKWF